MHSENYNKRREKRDSLIISRFGELVKKSFAKTDAYKEIAVEANCSESTVRLVIRESKRQRATAEVKAEF